MYGFFFLILFHFYFYLKSIKWVDYCEEKILSMK